jgi:tetratricopeptide (TPR) repeat protein
MGDAPARYGPTVGSGTYLPRIALAELHIQHRELEPARDLLQWCIRHHPEFVGVVVPYATVLLAAGVAPELVVEEIETRVELTPTARFMLANALYAHGAMAAAESQYRTVLASRPTSAQARAQVAEALLHQRRYGDAAAEAALLAEDEAFAALGCRIELWGRIAGGDLDGARAAHARAAGSGLSAAERQVFLAWLEHAEGNHDLRRLPVASMPLLGVILETLLWAHDFETFEQVAALLEPSELPWREQRELLASMYLRHGFLASAAQEWMAVCESEADARAFHGLARVAVANDQLEDAAVFANEAIRLDPANRAACELAAHLQETDLAPA